MKAVLHHSQPSEFILWPRDLCSTAQTPRHNCACRTAQHRPAPSQVNCYVDHKLCGTQQSGSLPLFTQKRLFWMQNKLGWWSVVGQPWLTAKPSQPLTHSPSSAGMKKKIAWEASWFEMQMGRLLNNYCCRQNWLKSGKINLLPIKIGLGSE